MNNRFLDGWRPHGLGLVFAAALLFTVAGHAAPTNADKPVRGPDNNAPDVTRLVTGDPAQINNAIAGTPPTAILAINPVPVPAGVTPPNPYPPGTTIVGNELRAEVGGFRAWFHVQVSNWDPIGDGPNAEGYEVKYSSIGYADSDLPGDQPNLAHAVAPCITDAECVAAFGESWARCYGACAAGYADELGTGRPDSWCAPEGGGCIEAFVSLIGGPTFYAVSAAATGRPDRGIVYYGATLVLDIPPAARGKYTVDLEPSLSAMWAPGSPPVDIQLLAAIGFVVNIAGRCCFSIGTPDEGCVDGVLRSECYTEPSPVVFTLGERCPPQGLDCRGFLGACCDTINGECQNEIVEADCQGAHRVWTSGASCGEAPCVAEIGACCNHDPFVPCTDAAVLSDCQCAACAWHKLLTCSEIECSPTPIPTVSEWGLVVLTLLLLTGAKIRFTLRKSSA